MSTSTSTSTSAAPSTAARSSAPPVSRPSSRSRRPGGARRFVGCFYLVMGGINAGIVAADPQTYRTFADGAFWSFVTTTWHEVVMTDPYVWFLLLAAGEIVLGLLLLHGGTAARIGWAGVIGFHVLLMAFGFGFWLWSLPALVFLVPAARSDWGSLARSPRPAPATASSPMPLPGPTARVPVAGGGDAAGRWMTVVLAALVTASSLYGLLAENPYRSLPDATVLGARAQDACSIAAAALLLGLHLWRNTAVDTVRLVRVGLLAYLTYSYLIYVTGVPMNRVFVVYVAIVGLSGAWLLVGVWDILNRPVPSRASRRLHLGTGWMLLVTAVLFSCLWLSTLIPFAFGGATPDPQGVGGTPYPIFWLDLAITLPAIAAVGVVLLRERPAGPSLAVVALVKVVMLFTALWAGPITAVLSGSEVHLGADAGPSLLLLAASTWLVVRWLRAMDPGHPTAPLSDRDAP